MNHLVRKQLEVLRAEFPQWRIRLIDAGWLAERDGVPAVVRERAHELYEALQCGERRSLGER
jgi:hypothetical protein